MTWAPPTPVRRHPPKPVSPPPPHRPNQMVPAELKSRRNRRIVIGVLAAAFFLAMVITGLVNANKSSDPGQKMTLTEAACSMLNKGDSAEVTYATMKDLAAQHPLVYGEDESIAARAAVVSAQAEGCG